MIEIQKTCDSSKSLDGLYCTLGVGLCIYFLLILAGSLYSIMKIATFSSKKGFKFEIMALATTIIQSILQFCLHFFIMDIRILMVAVYFETFTFSCVTMSFILIYHRLLDAKQEQKQLIKHRVQVCFSLLSLVLFIFMIVSLVDITEYTCQQWLSLEFLFPFLYLLISVFLSTYYGTKLYAYISTLLLKERSSTNSKVSDYSEQSVDSILDTGILNEQDSSYYRTLQQQIVLVMITAIFAFISNITMDLIRQFYLSDDIVCFGQFEFQIMDRQAEIFMMIYSFLQATPTLIIPYAFYYVPFITEKQNQNEFVQQDIFLEGSDFARLTWNRQETIVSGSNASADTINNQLIQQYDQDQRMKRGFSIEY